MGDLVDRVDSGEPLLAEWVPRVLIASILVFALLGMRLALVNRNPGSGDSRCNLDTARNLAEGRGFTSSTIIFFWDRQSFPNPETARPPGVPFVLGALIWLFGESLALPVLLNVVLILGCALTVRACIRRYAGPRWHADAAALLYLISFQFELISAWNIAFLNLATALLVLVGMERSAAGATKATALAAITAFGFLSKPTFVVGAVPFAVLALRPAPGPTDNGRREWARLVAGFMVIAAILTAPCWLRNWLLFGDPLYHPTKGARYALVYNLLPDDFFAIHTVRYGNPITFAEALHRIGPRGVLLCHWHALKSAAWTIFTFNVGLSVLLSQLLCVGGASRRAALLPLVMGFGPVFEFVYWSCQERYALPEVPVLLVVCGGLAAEAYRVADAVPGAVRRWAGIVLLATLAFALFCGLNRSVVYWRYAFDAATQFREPEWIKDIARLPPDAIVLASAPWDVAWFARRRAVMIPGGPRADLFQVIDQTHPTHVLVDGDEDRKLVLTRVQPGELRRSAGGERWELYELVRPARLQP